jgi:hypothetical protein
MPIPKPYVGKSYFSVYACEIDGVDSTEYVVSSIRRLKVNAIMKTSFTWGKVSKKHGDYGWLPNIPKWARKSWQMGERPYDLYTTKLLAINAEIRDVKNKPDSSFDNPDIRKRLLSTLKIMKTKELKKSRLARKGSNGKST